MSLLQIDAANQAVVSSLLAAYANENWQRIRYSSRWTPAGDVGSDDFWVSCEGAEIKRSPQHLNHYLAVSNAAKDHWRLAEALGLPRWYKMTVTVESCGKFDFAFEYKDDYKVGDIMQRAR